MAMYNVRVQNKRDTEANWATADPILLDGESIIVDTEAGEVRRKTGDGKTKYSLLPFDDAVLFDALEANMSKGRELTIAKGGWTNDSGDVNFPYQYVLSVEGVTTASRADAVLDAGSIVVASACGMCSACDTVEGSVVFKSYTAPTANLTGKLYVKKTAAMSGA